VVIFYISDRGQVVFASPSSILYEVGMTKPVQKRALQTRSKLLNAARKIVSAHGYSALRVEQVVLDAGVAKGTFFAHFQDKDAMMEIIVGNEIDALLSRAEVLTPPDSLSAFVAQVSPIMGFMTSERYIFDLIIRHSGAALGCSMHGSKFLRNQL